MKKIRVKNNIIWLILSLILLAQIGFFIYWNFFRPQWLLTFDAANAMTHVVEMWKNKTFFVPNWHDTTTLEIDSGGIIALPIYAICGNIFVSFAIANTLILLLYLYVTRDIAKKSFDMYNFKFVWLGFAIIFLTPFVVDMLGYYNMLFLHSSQYSIKVLIPLLIADLLITDTEEIKKPKTIVLAVISALLCALTALSSGLYVLLCGILPIIALGIFEWITGPKSVNVKNAIVLGGSIFASGVGLLAKRAFAASSRTDNMQIVEYEHFSDNLLAVITGYFKSLGGLPVVYDNQHISVTSFAGITFLLRLSVCVLLLLELAYRTIRVIKKEEDSFFARIACWVFYVNLAIFIFCDTRYSYGNKGIEERYYVIALVPLMFLTAEHAVKLIYNISDKVKKIVMITAAMIYLLAIVVSNCANVKREANEAAAEDVIQLINDNCGEVESVILLREHDQQGVYRLLDPKHTYGAYIPEDGVWPEHDYYADYPNYLGESNAIVIWKWENLPDILGQEWADKYEKIGEVRWLCVYRSEENGFPR